MNRYNRIHVLIFCAPFLVYCKKPIQQQQNTLQCETMKRDGWKYRKRSLERETAGSIESSCFSVSKNAIDDTFKRNISHLYDCFEKRRTVCAESQKLSIRVKVHEEGLVGQAMIYEGTHYDVPLMNCIETQIKSWSFPKPKHTNSYEFIYPIRIY